jgi:hypothetical protein
MKVRFWPAARVRRSARKLTFGKRGPGTDLTGTVWASRRRILVGPQLGWKTIMGSNVNAGRREPWNKGKIVGQKAPFKVKHILALRV